MSDKHFARRPHEYLGKQYDRGQVMDLQGARNDEKLVRLGYIAEVPRDTVLKECGDCGAKFIGEGERNGHVKERHRERFLSPEEEDAHEASQERILESVAPLYLDKTKASRESATAEVNTAPAPLQTGKTRPSRAGSRAAAASR